MSMEQKAKPDLCFGNGRVITDDDLKSFEETVRFQYVAGSKLLGFYLELIRLAKIGKAIEGSRR